MSKKRMIIQIVEILAGVILLGLGVTGIVDEFWSGMGGALIGVGVMQKFIDGFGHVRTGAPAGICPQGRKSCADLRPHFIDPGQRGLSFFAKSVSKALRVAFPFIVPRIPVQSP